MTGNSSSGSVWQLEQKVYSLITSRDGIKAREIARILGADRSEVNRCLYTYPFIHDLCVRDQDYYWHGLIRQARPHSGLGDFCGWYGLVREFRGQSEEEWFVAMTEGCSRIGRNLNDTRGLFHSFRDTRQVMLDLFADMKGINTDEWELCFELRIRRSRYIRIYADVLVFTEDRCFSLEFKMKDEILEEELLQAGKYVPYLEVILGRDYDVIPALVLTRAEDLYRYVQLPGSTAEIPVLSGDMLFNLFDEYIGNVL